MTGELIYNIIEIESTSFWYIKYFIFASNIHKLRLTTTRLRKMRVFPTRCDTVLERLKMFFGRWGSPDCDEVVVVCAKRIQLWEFMQFENSRMCAVWGNGSCMAFCFFFVVNVCSVWKCYSKYGENFPVRMFAGNVMRIRWRTAKDEEERRK